MSKVRYTGRVKYRPSGPDDPIPWSARLYRDGEWIDSRWRGTRDEAIEALREMQHADENQGEVEEIEL